MRKILGLLAALALGCSAGASQQTIVTTTPGTPAPVAGAIINANFSELYGKFAGQIFIAPSGDTSGIADMAALTSAVAAVASSNRLPPIVSAFLPTAKIVLGPGTFYFTTGGLNLVSAANTKKLQGVWVQGSGRGVTSIDYNPATPGPLIVNNHALNVKWSDTTFVGHDSASDFLWSQEQAGITNVQDYAFVDDDWQGIWQHVFRLTGGNNNSEWKFDRDSFTGSFISGIYTPPAVVATITNGSNSVAITNNAEQVEVGDTGILSAACAPLTAGPSYYVVSATTTTMQVATSPGGTPVTFTASCTPNFLASSDQFLNFWFSKVKWWTVASPGQWLLLNTGGSVKINESDISGHAPSAAACVFNLLGNSHAGGVMNFEVDGLRVEHAGNNSCLIHSQWNGGSIQWNNLDESSQAGLRTITNKYAQYDIINAVGPLISYKNSQLMGQHQYTTGTSSFFFQNQILYEEVTLIDNPTAATFISIVNGGNSGGLPRIRFNKSRNLLNSNTVGYHEVVDTDLNWNVSLGGQTGIKTTSCSGTNGDFPINGNAVTIRFPLNAIIVAFRYWNPGGAGLTGAYQYTLQTTETTPTVLAGGASTPLAGANSSTPLAITSQYLVNSTTLPFEMTSDTKRTVQLIDTLPRTTVFTGVRCLIDYIG